MEKILDTDDDKLKRQTMKSTVCKVIDEMPEGYEFYGWQLKEMVVAKYPKCQHCYVDTILKIMRRDRRLSCLCIDHVKSLYRKTAV